jgi:transposase
MDREVLEGFLAEELSLAEIGRRVERHEATVSYWVTKYGLAASRRATCAARGGIARDDLVALVERGASIAEIAEAVSRSKATVRHWLQK